MESLPVDLLPFLIHDKDTLKSMMFVSKTLHFSVIGSDFDLLDNRPISLKELELFINSMVPGDKFGILIGQDKQDPILPIIYEHTGDRKSLRQEVTLFVEKGALRFPKSSLSFVTPLCYRNSFILDAFTTHKILSRRTICGRKYGSPQAYAKKAVNDTLRAWIMEWSSLSHEEILRTKFDDKHMHFMIAYFDLCMRVISIVPSQDIEAIAKSVDGNYTSILKYISETASPNTKDVIGYDIFIGGYDIREAQKRLDCDIRARFSDMFTLVGR